VPCFFCNNKFLINLNKKVIMGRGDIKTKKGKIFAGSFGKSRPAKAAKKVVAPAVVVEKKKAAPKKKA
jgi:30S ribosomal protein S31